MRQTAEEEDRNLISSHISLIQTHTVKMTTEEKVGIKQRYACSSSTGLSGTDICLVNDNILLELDIDRKSMQIQRFLLVFFFLLLSFEYKWK